MEKYSKYKDSGVKWIGDVPAHWEVKKLRNLISIISVKNHPNETLLSVVREQGVIVRDLDADDNHNYIPEDLSGYKLIKEGQFVINKMKAWQGSYAVSSYRGIVSPAYYTCDLRLAYKSYFNLAIRSSAYVPFFTQYSKGIRVGQWDLSPIGLKEIPFFLPPLAEQRAIVSYLDGKVGQIDTYIAKQTQQIELLKELKQAVIANAVTKGIGTNPNTKRKQSGVNWLGEIPEHWEVSKLRKHFIPRIQKVSDKDFAPLSVTKDGILPQLDTACKTDNGENRKLVRKGDYVVNSRSDRKGSGGISPFDGSVSLINIVIYPIDGEQEYYHYLFRCNNFVEEFYRNGRGIVADLWTTRYQEMKNIEIPIPPLSEQRAIVSYIEAQTANINKLIDAYQQQVERIKEYKQRLISDAVTGKINVTDEQTQTN